MRGTGGSVTGGLSLDRAADAPLAGAPLDEGPDRAPPGPAAIEWTALASCSSREGLRIPRFSRAWRTRLRLFQSEGITGIGPKRSAMTWKRCNPTQSLAPASAPGPTTLFTV